MIRRKNGTSIYDSIIIGAGSAGLSALRVIKKKTDNYLMIEAGPFGTTCARVGCMPSKVLIEAANAYHNRHKFEAFGIRGSQELKADIPAVMRRVRALRDHYVSFTLKTIESLGDHLLTGRATIKSPSTVEVEGKEYHTRSLIIATGSTPVLLEPWRQLGSRILTSDTIFEQEDLPKRLGVIGLGIIGVELAQACARLGVEVIAYNRSENLAGLIDQKINESLRRKLESDFEMHLKTDVELEHTKDGVLIRTANETRTVDKVLVAIGRTPNINGLGLENLGVELMPNGLPKFSPTTMQVANLPVFIAGDVNQHAPILHEAIDEGYIAGSNALRDEPTCYQRRTPITIMFSDPGVASVGLKYHQLDLEQTAIGDVDFANQGRALAGQKNYGLLRIYAKRSDGRILGAEMCAPAAEHFAHHLAFAISQGSDVRALLKSPFYHPVLEEGLRTALRDLAKQTHLGHHSDLSACPSWSDL